MRGCGQVYHTMDMAQRRPGLAAACAACSVLQHTHTTVQKELQQHVPAETVPQPEALMAKVAPAEAVKTPDAAVAAEQGTDAKGWMAGFRDWGTVDSVSALVIVGWAFLVFNPQLLY